jgi:alpha-1,2-mannosyltransferase
LAASGLVLALGVFAAVLVGRAGQPALGVCLAGVTSLLASPISWSHHYIWIVPLGIALWQAKALPAWFRAFGGFYVFWFALSPFKYLPKSHFVELHYNLGQHLIADSGVYLGVLLLVAGLVVALRARSGKLALPS